MFQISSSTSNLIPKKIILPLGVENCRFSLKIQTLTWFTDELSILAPTIALIIMEKVHTQCIIDRRGSAWVKLKLKVEIKVEARSTSLSFLKHLIYAWRTHACIAAYFKHRLHGSCHCRLFYLTEKMRSAVCWNVQSTFSRMILSLTLISSHVSWGWVNFLIDQHCNVRMKFENCLVSERFRSLSALTSNSKHAPTQLWHYHLTPTERTAKRNYSQFSSLSPRQHTLCMEMLHDNFKF